MKEFIEKLIEKLEEKFKYNSEQAEIYRKGSDKDAYFREKKDLYMDRANTYGEVMRIINELAEEYNNAWIPCSERLPEEEYETVLAVSEQDYGCYYFIAVYTSEHGFRTMDCGVYEEPVAWQPLPELYKIADTPQEN